MVVLNLDHEALAQQWSPPESEPALFWFNAGRVRAFPSASAGALSHVRRSACRAKSSTDNFTALPALSPPLVDTPSP
jgi:hypothetical protein